MQHVQQTHSPQLNLIHLWMLHSVLLHLQATQNVCKGIICPELYFKVDMKHLGALL